MGLVQHPCGSMRYAGALHVHKHVLQSFGMIRELCMAQSSGLSCAKSILTASWTRFPVSLSIRQGVTSLCRSADSSAPMVAKAV
jgi:hypothetical protein